MNLSIDNALHGVGELLRDRIGPEIADPFASQMSRLSCLLLKICANWVDDAAELRVEENAAIRTLLANAAPFMNPSIVSRFAEAASSRDPGLKVSVLDSENDRLRRLLVEAQAHLEVDTDASALELVQRIWRFFEQAERIRAPRE